MFRTACFVIFLYFTSISFSNGAKKSQKEEQLPAFYLASKISKCSLDSPELYMEKIALPALNSTLEGAYIPYNNK
jgi:hypothetical protein